MAFRTQVKKLILFIKTMERETIRILIPASKVSCFSNHNKYSTDEERHEILLRYNNWYREKYDNSVPLTPLEKVDEIINSSYVKDPSVSIEKENVIKETLKKQIREDINKCIKVESDIEPQNIIKKIKNTELKTAVEKIVYVERGTLKEDKDIKKYEEKTAIKTAKSKSKSVVEPIQPIERPTKVYYKDLARFTHDNENYRITIVGRVDGILDDYIIETKHRKNKLFNYIPIYEKIQVEMYFVLLKLKKCKFIENFNNEQNVIEYDHNPKLLEEIIHNLKIHFIELLQKIK